MNSLGTGISPTVNARVTKVRKAQLQKLADMRGLDKSDLIREAIDTLIKKTIAAEKSAMMKVAADVADSEDQ